MEVTKGKILRKAFFSANVRLFLLSLLVYRLRNVQTWACGLGFGLSSLSLQGLALFIPTIIRGIDPAFGTLEIQVKTCPVCEFIPFLLENLGCSRSIPRNRCCRLCGRHHFELGCIPFRQALSYHRWCKCTIRSCLPGDSQQLHRSIVSRLSA